MGAPTFIAMSITLQIFSAWRLESEPPNTVKSLLSGVWSLVHIQSFIAVTGPKTDVWLVKTVGVLVSVIGLSLLVMGLRGEVDPGLALVAVGSAVGLLVIEVAYALQRVIGVIYLGDALLEAVFVAWWVAVQ
jgi:hypothetical protein